MLRTTLISSAFASTSAVSWRMLCLRGSRALSARSARCLCFSTWLYDTLMITPANRWSSHLPHEIWSSLLHVLIKQMPCTESLYARSGALVFMVHLYSFRQPQIFTLSYHRQQCQSRLATASQAEGSGPEGPT